MVMEFIVAGSAMASLAYILHPLVTDDPQSLWDSEWWLSDDDTTTAEAPTERGRAITDGGHVCQNCGAPLGGDFTYCGECVTPVK